MSVRRKQNFLNQQRVNVPDIRSIESAVSNDFDELLKGLVTGQGKSYFVNGFEINMTGAVNSSATGLQVLVADSAVLHTNSTESGTFYTVPTGTPNEVLNSNTNSRVSGSFVPGALNYVGLEYERVIDPTTTTQAYFWNPSNKSEFTKTVPSAIILKYKFVITSSIWASNVLPLAVIETDVANNVVSVEDRRPLLFRLGSAGSTTPNPDYTYPWTNHPEGRVENFWKSNSSSSPFRGGDKQIKNEKEWKDAIMSVLKEIKGTPYWYSENVGGSLVKLRMDLANLVMTGSGSISHSDTTPGRLNWNSDIYLTLVTSRLSYKLQTNPASSFVTLADNEVAYIKLIRGENITPNLIFVNGSDYVESVGAASWTNDIQAGDYIKLASELDTKYVKVASVDSAYEVTLEDPWPFSGTGSGGAQVQYAWGTYEAVASPSTDRHVWIVNREDVPFQEDIVWLFLRQDNSGSPARVYIRGMAGGELEEGESVQISDNTSEEILQYIGATDESDFDPNYNSLATDAKTSTENYNSTNGENLTIRASNLTSMMADKAQDKTVQLVSDHTTVFNTTNGADQDITFSGGSGTANVIVPSSANNGTIGLSGTLSLAVNEVAYYQIDRNASFSIANLAGLTISSIASAPLDENTFIFAYRLADTNVYLWNNQVLLTGSSIALSVLRGYVQQNKTVKLVKGGTWSWDLPSNTLANSSSAYLQVGGLAENVNEISAQSIVLNADGQCAYVTLKRTSGASVLTVNTANIASVPQDDHTFIIARRAGSDVLVGTSSFALKDGEFLELDGALAEINRYHGQLAMAPKSPISTRVKISGSDILKLSGSQISLEQKKLLLSFEGAEIDFLTGSVYETDGVTSFLGGVNDFTPATIGSNEYFFYSISVLPYVVQADNTISGQVLVIPSSASNAVLASAPRAPFPSSGIKLGNVYVQEDGGGGILDIDYSNIVQLGVGGSGSGGTGDANSFTENLKHRLMSSYYEYVTPVVFETDEENLTDSATATFSIVDGAYKFTAAGQNFISINMFDAEFLANSDDSRRVELHAEWFDSASRDDSATYEASLDGTNYQTVTMTRQGLSQKFTGDILLNVPSSVSLFAQPTDTQTTELDATSLRSIATKFTVADKSAINQLVLRLVKTGSPNGSYTISIVEDSSNSPTGDVLYSKIALCSSLSAGVNIVTLSDFRNVLASGSYWVKIETDATYKTSFVASTTSIGVRSTTGGTDFVYNGTIWSAGTDSIRYQISGHEYDLRVRITSSASDKKLKAYGIFYDEQVGSVITGVQALQKFTFSGNLNTTDFTVTGFLPDADHMKIYDIKTGQVYRYPAFSISGHNVTFPSGTFLVPGETVELIFDQSQGSGYDNSDANANLLAANHLGSTDGTIDKSSSGRGIFLRRPDGTLREICIDNSDNIVIYSV